MCLLLLKWIIKSTKEMSYVGCNVNLYATLLSNFVYQLLQQRKAGITRIEQTKIFKVYFKWRQWKRCTVINRTEIVIKLYTVN